MKKQIKKKIWKILLLTIGLAFLVKQSGLLNKLNKPETTAYAVGDLTVDWGVPNGDPIFVINNFLPEQKEIREVKVTNDATVVRPVGIRGIKTAETGNLSSALELVVSQNGNDLYGGTSATGVKTLLQFFEESANFEGISLSNLSSGESANYVFTVSFIPESGNEFQGKNLVFDLEIGIFIPIPEECREIKFSNLPIFGTQGNDKLKGTNGNDLIFGFEGDDKIDGSNGDDCLIGGIGNDRLDGSNGNDVILGNEGDDKINASNGNDLVLAGPGNDFVDGSNGDDRIYGGEGDDRIEGKNGNDLLDGNEGTDVANGGLGKDSCQAETKIKCEN